MVDMRVQLQKVQLQKLNVLSYCLNSWLEKLLAYCDCLFYKSPLSRLGLVYTGTRLFGFCAYACCEWKSEAVKVEASEQIFEITDKSVVEDMSQLSY